MPPLPRGPGIDRRWPMSRVLAWAMAIVVIAGSAYYLGSRGGSTADATGLPPDLAAALGCGTLGPSQPATTDYTSGGCQPTGSGPDAADFVNILTLSVAAPVPPIGAGGSGGSFGSQCGRNQEGHHNSDNFIVAPGVVNGAHHVHDYVGNVTTDGRTTDASLAAGGTTCELGDQSTYFWPVLRQIGAVGGDADADGGGHDHNAGKILTPQAVQLQFLGNATSRVVAMPRFIRVITGDAKAFTNGPTNAHAQWTCVGLNDRVTGTQYPLCPNGAVERVLEFPSCWDRVHTDSANHRTQIIFPGSDGACASGTVAVPRLRMTLTYSVPSGRSFAVDSFPEQLHKPGTDHADFVNVMPDALMALVVTCINVGRSC